MRDTVANEYTKKSQSQSITFLRESNISLHRNFTEIEKKNAKTKTKFIGKSQVIVATDYD